MPTMGGKGIWGIGGEPSNIIQDALGYLQRPPGLFPYLSQRLFCQLISQPQADGEESPRRYTPPPKWGEHTEDILTSTLGYSQEKRDELRRQNII